MEWIEPVEPPHVPSHPGRDSILVEYLPILRTKRHETIARTSIPIKQIGSTQLC